MFDLVADVDRYDEFVPGCRRITIRDRTVDGRIETVLAEMEIGHRLISETLPCRIRLDAEALAIDVDNTGGPLKTLENRWRFRKLDGDHCEVEFDIAFSLRSPVLGLVVGGLFERVFLKMVDAFEARADALYGAEAGA